MIELNSVIKHLGPGVLFECESFNAVSGDHIALWGPSGCGKSTMLNLVSGLLRSESGDVIVNDIKLQELSEGQLDRFRGENIGFVFQTFNLLNPFTALQNVLLGMRFSDTLPEKEWKQHATELLIKVGLEHRLHSKPQKMSVGEKQRVAIARALANKPKLIVADEPTGSLDPKNARSVMDLLLELCQENELTMLMVTHDRSLAEELPNLFDCSSLVKETQS